MKNKKTLVAILAIFAIVLVGGSFAYFRYTQSFANNFKLGTEKMTFTESFDSPSNWTPCTTTPKTLVVKNTSTVPMNARVKLTQYWEKLDDNGQPIENSTLPLTVGGESMATIHFTNTSDWVLNADGYYYYKHIIAVNGSSNSFIDSVTFNCDATAVDYSSARYHLVLKVETIEADASARQNEGWNWNF